MPFFGLGTFIDGEPIIRLPRKTINLIQSEFSKEERDFYRELEANSLSQFKVYAFASYASSFKCQLIKH